MKEYIPKYRTLLDDGSVRSRLPGPIQRAIEKFERAREAIKGINKERQLDLQKILIQADAVISAGVHKASGKPLAKQHQLPGESVNIDAAKVLAMKAKALRLKWRMKKS